MVHSKKSGFEPRIATASLNFVPTSVRKNTREHMGVAWQPLATSLQQKLGIIITFTRCTPTFKVFRGNCHAHKEWNIKSITETHNKHWK